jgi:hypothetical protein
MHDLNCSLKLSIEVNDEHQQFSIDAESVGSIIKVSISGIHSQIGQEREPLALKPIVSLEIMTPTRVDAVAYIKDQIQILLDKALELPPIRL